MDYSAQQLIKSLEKQGVKFKSFQQKHRGRYSADDADWNYKDVPHLAVIHHLVDATLASVTEEHVASINLQKILGFRFPVTVYNYHPKDGVQTYFTTLFFYVLIIETNPIRLGENETEVVTTYNIGAAGWWMVFFPLLRWLLRRNYDDLMSGDIPMRERRGQLRDWGYRFKYDTEACGFHSTINISKTNTYAPENEKPAVTNYQVSAADLERKTEIFLGRDDIHGVRLILKDGKVSVYPRMCPHEGASLDGSPCENKVIKCPWHLRPFGALATVDFTEQFTIPLKQGIIERRGTTIAYTLNV